MRFYDDNLKILPWNTKTYILHIQLKWELTGNMTANKKNHLTISQSSQERWFTKYSAWLHQLRLCHVSNDSHLIVKELHQVMDRLRQDRMGVTEINIIFPKLSSDYDLSKPKLISRRIQFPPQCDMLLSVRDYSQADSNESSRGKSKAWSTLMRTVVHVN